MGHALVLRLLGVGAMRSPRYAPAGVLVQHGGVRVMIDGGADVLPPGRLDAWLVTDLHAELIASIRRAARLRGLEPRVGPFVAHDLSIRPRRVAHTSHATYGYLIESAGARVVWAPEFMRFPRWAAGADLMLAEAAGYARAIHFAGGVGGHMAAVDVARHAHACRVRRLVLAHIGRPSIRARDAGHVPPHAEWGNDGDVLVVDA
jgi:hypothetical protein